MNYKEDQFNNDTQLSHAITFAISAHEQSGQTREDKITPYHAHILRVVERLQGAGVTDKDVLVAAALHDVVEDCGVTYEYIEKLFGKQVRIYVEEMTIAPGEQKEGRDYFEKLGNASKGGKTIKLADKWDNIWELRTQQYDSYGDASPVEYNKNAKIVLDACGDANQKLATHLREEIKHAEQSFV